MFLWSLCATIFLSQKSGVQAVCFLGFVQIHTVQEKIETARLWGTDASLNCTRQGSFGHQGTHSAEQDKSVWQIHSWCKYISYFWWQLISSCHISKIIIISYFQDEEDEKYIYLSLWIYKSWFINHPYAEGTSFFNPISILILARERSRYC